MFRSHILLSVALFAMIGCGTDSANQVRVSLTDGTTGTIYLEEESVDGGNILVVDYKSDRARKRESEVQDDIERIWESVRPEAEERGFEEALIKYRMPDPDSDETGLYSGLLFEAERIENGTWKLRKVN